MFAIAADDSAVARITLTGTTSGGSCQLTLIENPDYSAAYDNGYDAPCNINLSEALPKTLFMYSYIGANTYSTIATNNLDGLEFGFISNLLDEEYTMTFEVFAMAPGRTLTIYDMSEPETVVIDPSNHYTFDATSGHHEYMRFVINYTAPAVNPLNVTLNAFGWATYSYTSDVEIPDGLTAYRGVVSGDALNLYAIGTKVPANTGVILGGAASANFTLTETTGAAAVSDNDLRPTSAFDPANYSNVFVLKGESLVQYVGSTALAANKAYLQLPGTTPAPKRIRMVINQTTGVENVEALEAPVKFVENGQIFIRRGNEVYNLQGQMVR